MNSRLLDTLLLRMDAGPEARVERVPCASGAERTDLLLDCSGSMDAGDYPPTRLQAAFDAGLEFVTARKGAGFADRISVVLFNKDAKFICRDVSLDKGMEVLRRLKVQNPIGGGTDLNAGLAAAEQHFCRTLEGYQNRIVLLTDGHGGNPVQTGERLRAAGVLLDVIGVAGDPAAVAEEQLRKIASVINGVSRYRFIGNRAELLQHFKTIATNLMRVN